MLQVVFDCHNQLMLKEKQLSNLMDLNIDEQAKIKRISFKKIFFFSFTLVKWIIGDDWDWDGILIILLY